MDIDFHDLARIQYWVCENEEQAKAFKENLRERHKRTNPFLVPNRPHRVEQQRLDNLLNIPDEINSTTLELPNQERGDAMERLIYKGQAINRMIMDASIVGLASHRKVRLEKHITKLLEIVRTF